MPTNPPPDRRGGDSTSFAAGLALCAAAAVFASLLGGGLGLAIGLFMGAIAPGFGLK